jgi:hypothetical protein
LPVVLMYVGAFGEELLTERDGHRCRTMLSRAVVCPCMVVPRREVRHLHPLLNLRLTKLD